MPQSTRKRQLPSVLNIDNFEKLSTNKISLGNDEELSFDYKPLKAGENFFPIEFKKDGIRINCDVEFEGALNTLRHDNKYFEIKTGILGYFRFTSPSVTNTHLDLYVLQGSSFLFVQSDFYIYLKENGKISFLDYDSTNNVAKNILDVEGPSDDYSQIKLYRRGSASDYFTVKVEDTGKVTFTASGEGGDKGYFNWYNDDGSLMSLSYGGNLSVKSNLTLLNGGSIQNSSAVAGITMDSDGEISKIGLDTPADGEVLTWDNTNSKVVWSAVGGGSGDIEGVDLTGGTGIEIASETGTTSGSYSATINCDLEGTELKSTGVTGTAKFLRVDGDGSCSWQTPSYIANTNQLTTFNIGVDTNTNATTIAHGETLTFTGGTGISTETTADGTITFTNTVTNTNDDVSVANLDARLEELTATAVTVGDATDVTMNFSGGIQVGQGAVFMTEPTVTSGLGMHAFTWKQGNKLDLTLISGANQITFDTTHPAGGCNVTLKLTQPSSGSAGTVSLWTATGGGYNIKWAGGSAPTLSTANNAIDILSFYFDGATYFGVASLNFS